MGNQDTPLHRFDDTQKAHDDEWLADASAVKDVLERARIEYESITPHRTGIIVAVPHQRDVLGRVKRMYDAMTDAKFAITYGVNAIENTEAYWFSRLKGE